MSQPMSSLVPSKIIGIQFGMMSPEDIRKGSVVEIQSRDTYTNNQPVNRGLFDVRMGVQDPGLVCPTDGRTSMDCPGYFGHLELARPVFYMQYFPIIQKFTRVVCFKCSKLLLSKTIHAHAMQLPEYARWKYVSERCLKIKRCGTETHDGCGCVQPKIVKTDMCTLFAEWKCGDRDSPDLIRIPLTPELLLKQFRRVSDDDVTFAGFNPRWARPEWMICQVLAVPPPSVRPSVKHDLQQRSEDDLTHILVQIIKANKTLQDKINNQAPDTVLATYTSLLQFHVAVLVDNKIVNTNPAAQRTGRPLKSIKERHTGKTGRMRGNLMAKRVDFSARSVITADPNLPIGALGVPRFVAMHLTKPVRVNARNRAFLQRLIRNGPDVWPGANMLERVGGQLVTLRYASHRDQLLLQFGDIVHRHLMNHDPVLFNRQPTLHRPSMMCHYVIVMEVGETFRMNVSVTKPYNADFDGDEMNMHVPQGLEADAELEGLAAVPFNLISPANNTPIIGIFQDSMLGCYQFTRDDVFFSPEEAMQLVMRLPSLEGSDWIDRPRVTPFELLSHVLPPLSMWHKTNECKDDEDLTTSNHVVEIVNGTYVRGQLDKGTLGASTRGLIHRICNDYGNRRAAAFIDHLQSIITTFMKQSGFSVGILDLVTRPETDAAVERILTTQQQAVDELLSQVQLGVFDNFSGKSNVDELETQINNLLSKGQNDAGRAALNALHPCNRFKDMFRSGAKGSELNIQQMTACLGQQTVDGKRIPYGFEHRTLPHFTKFDDSAVARGFVQRSFTRGLSPTELFFHAMGGRTGLIDTAVKTSRTGYIQRRLVKALEDLMVHYDLTVRTSKNRIVQYVYGDDGMDPMRVETQDLPLVRMTVQQVYAHFVVPVGTANESEWTSAVRHVFVPALHARMQEEQEALRQRTQDTVDWMLSMREPLVRHVFRRRSDTKVRVPVAFAALIANLQGQQQLGPTSQVDLTLLEAWGMLDAAWNRLDTLSVGRPTMLFRVLFYFYLSPKKLLVTHRFHRVALESLLETVVLQYLRALIAPGELVGILAAQSIGEPTTQMTLNTFHFAGVASKSNVTRGVPRIEEILMLSASMKNPSLTVYLPPRDEQDKDKAVVVQNLLEHTRLGDLVLTAECCFDPSPTTTLLAADREWLAQFHAFQDVLADCLTPEDESAASATSTLVPSKWIVRLVMDRELMLDKNITMDDVHFALQSSFKNEVDCVFSDYNCDQLVFRLRPLSKPKPAASTRAGGAKKPRVAAPLDASDEVFVLQQFQDLLLQQVVLRGVFPLTKVLPRKIKDHVVLDAGVYRSQDMWVLDTSGTNLLDVLGLDYVDATRTISNDLREIASVLGVEAARQSIYNEITEVLEFDGAYVNSHHPTLLIDRQTSGHQMVSIFRCGINKDNIGPIAKASFEETPEIFLRAARHAELDTMRGVSANVMTGQPGFFGTSSFQVFMDLDRLPTGTEEQTPVPESLEQEIARLLGEQGPLPSASTQASSCTPAALEMPLPVASAHVHAMDLSVADTYNPFL
jgi:DNA-directed RNA polymerase II subunit RPB1